MCDSGVRVSWQSGKRQANTCAQPSNVQRRFGAGGLSDPGTAGSIFDLPLHRRVLVDKLAESIGLFERHDVIAFLLAIGFKARPVINDSHVSFIQAKRNLLMIGSLIPLGLSHNVSTAASLRMVRQNSAIVFLTHRPALHRKCQRAKGCG